MPSTRAGVGRGSAQQPVELACARRAARAAVERWRRHEPPTRGEAPQRATHALRGGRDARSRCRSRASARASLRGPARATSAAGSSTATRHVPSSGAQPTKRVPAGQPPELRQQDDLDVARRRSARAARGTAGESGYGTKARTPAADRPCAMVVRGAPPTRRHRERSDWPTAPERCARSPSRRTTARPSRPDARSCPIPPAAPVSDEASERDGVGPGSPASIARRARGAAGSRCVRASASNSSCTSRACSVRLERDRRAPAARGRRAAGSRSARRGSAAALPRAAVGLRVVLERPEERGIVGSAPRRRPAACCATAVDAEAVAPLGRRGVDVRAGVARRAARRRAVASNERQSLWPWPPRPASPTGPQSTKTWSSPLAQHEDAAVAETRQTVAAAAASRDARPGRRATQPPRCPRPVSPASGATSAGSERWSFDVLSAERQRAAVVRVAPERRDAVRPCVRRREAAHRRTRSRRPRARRGRARVAKQRGQQEELADEPVVRGRRLEVDAVGDAPAAAAPSQQDRPARRRPSGRRRARARRRRARPRRRCSGCR